MLLSSFKRWRIWESFINLPKVTYLARRMAERFSFKIYAFSTLLYCPAGDHFLGLTHSVLGGIEFLREGFENTWFIEGVLKEKGKQDRAGEKLSYNTFGLNSETVLQCGLHPAVTSVCIARVGQLKRTHWRRVVKTNQSSCWGLRGFPWCRTVL